MNLDTAVERATSVAGPKSAARLYNNIEYELAMGEPSSDQENDGERALAILERRYPGVQDQARDLEEPPSTSRRANANLHGARRRSTPRTAPSGRRERQGGRRPAQGARRTGRAPSRPQGPLRTVDRGADWLAGRDVTGTFLQGLRFLLLAGIGYLLLSDKGATAFSSVLRGVVTGADRFLAPVDPLAKAGKTSKTGKQANAPPGTPQVNLTPLNLAPVIPGMAPPATTATPTFGRSTTPPSQTIARRNVAGNLSGVQAALNAIPGEIAAFSNLTAPRAAAVPFPSGFSFPMFPIP